MSYQSYTHNQLVYLSVPLTQTSPLPENHTNGSKWETTAASQLSPFDSPRPQRGAGLAGPCRQRQGWPEVRIGEAATKREPTRTIKINTTVTSDSAASGKSPPLGAKRVIRVWAVRRAPDQGTMGGGASGSL